MAETKQGTNWADMEHEEEDDQEIGVQKKDTTGAATEESKKTEEGAQEGATQGTEEGKDQQPYPRKRKDYGDKYDPNYKNRKGPWRKPYGAEAEPVQRNKNLPPPQPRQKTDRGDYVVTSFQIPDRIASIKADAKKTEGAEGETKQKKRRVGAFQLDDSDLEEGEQQTAVATEDVKEEEEEPVKEETTTKVTAPTPAPVAAKPLSKKEQKKKELEELEALLGNIPASTEQQTKPAESTKTEESKTATAEGGAAGEGKKKKKKKPAKAEEGVAATEEQKTEAAELTPEQKQAAIKAALEKRNAPHQRGGKESVLLAAKAEKAERKQKGKKSKADDFDR